ncbi:DinB family protein [Propionibacteriaceae bacterium Y2011]|uniref:DinB family protein n=1 Tax=Microlunatus sp. Y2014 TaxID=3418488 RepID=UPI003B4B8681
MTIDWTRELGEQLTWHWNNQLRARLDGLTDDEYFWEPVPGWNVRPRGTSTAEIQAGSGDFTIDFAFPPPEPAPVTTIAWRLGHVIVGVFGARNHSHFDGPEADYFGWDYAGTADEALAQLDAQYAHWTRAIAQLDPADLARPVGEAEGGFADKPMATLVLHIHREVIHHGAEIALLRDLYARR